MTYRVYIEPPALDAIARGMDTDRAGAITVFEFIDALAHDPRPAPSVAWGPEYRRAHLGSWRVLYRIDETIGVVTVENVGRTEKGHERATRE